MTDIYLDSDARHYRVKIVIDDHAIIKLDKKSCYLSKFYCTVWTDLIRHYENNIVIVNVNQITR